MDHIMMTCSDAAPSAGNSCAATSFSDLELESRLFHITDAAEGWESRSEVAVSRRTELRRCYSRLSRAGAGGF